MNFLTLLPMAFVMIAGPQILSSIFLATSDNWRRVSAAYIAGAALSITLIVTIAYLVLNGAADQGASNDTIYVIVLVLLVAAMVNVYRKRKTSEPPKWMGKLQTATPKFAFTLGLLLLGVFPTDIISSFSVGGSISRDGHPWTYTLPFILLTVFLVALPGLLVLVLGKRAAVFLPKVRDWMNNNSWVVSEIVIVLFIVLTANSLASG